MDSVFLAMDQQGFIINTTSEEKIKAPWETVVREVKLACLNNLSGKLRSLYVAGSVAHGTAIPGTSDIDMYAIVDGELATLDISWWKKNAQEISTRYPFVSKIDIVFLPYADFLSPHRLSLAKFVLKTQATCIFGEDLAVFIAPYQPGERTLFQVYLIKKNIARTKIVLAHSKNTKHAQLWSSWIMKRILRTGFELVLEKEKKYPAGISTCYLAFAKHYPVQAPDMNCALDYARSPPLDKTVTINYLNRFGPWIVQHAQKFIEQHTSSKSRSKDL